MDLLIRNGRVIDPLNQMDIIGDVLISDGKIREVCLPPGSHHDCEILDATNMIVCPGFIDLHCHLRQPGFEEKETIATGTAAAAAGGFTTICCMPNTHPCIDNETALKNVLTLAVDTGKVQVLPVACITVNQEGKKLTDMARLLKMGAVAFSDDGKPVVSDWIMEQALEYSKSLKAFVIDHCEDPILSSGGSVNQGAVAQKMGIQGIPAESEERMVKRDVNLAAKNGSWIHIAHVSTAGSVETIRKAKKAGVNVTAEATPHHLTLTEELVLTVGTNAKVNPPLRTEKDRRTLVEGVNDGTIDIIATDHAPHTSADKSGDFERAAFGISGFETALGSLMVLVHTGEMEMMTLLSKLTCEPAQMLGIQDIGNLNAGSRADIIVVNPDTEWKVNPGKFASKGKNTPLEGQILKSLVIYTIKGGSIVHRSC